MHAVLTEAVEHARELPFAPVVFGIGAFVGLIAMLLVTYAFRSAGTRHE